MRKFVSIFLATSLVAGSAFAQTTNLYTKDGTPVETAGSVSADPAAPAPVVALPKPHKTVETKHAKKATHKTTTKKAATHKKKKTTHKTAHKAKAKKAKSTHHVKKTASAAPVATPAPMAAPVASPEPTAPVAPMAPGTTGQ